MTFASKVKEAKEAIVSGQPLSLIIGQKTWSIANKVGEMFQVDYQTLPWSDPLVTAWLIDENRTKVVFSATTASEQVWRRGKIPLRGAIGYKEAIHLLTAGLPVEIVEQLALQHFHISPYEMNADRLEPERLYNAVRSVKLWARTAGLEAELVSDARSATVLGRMTASGIPIRHDKWESIAEQSMLSAATARRRIAEHLGLSLTDRSLNSPQALSRRYKVTTPDLEVWQRAEILAQHATDPRSGALWPCWQATASTTGRITATNPNVVGLPTEYASAISAPGAVIITADWTNQELWIAALLAKDVHLIDLLRQGDPYTLLSESMGIPRPAAKQVLLGSLYGAARPKEVVALAKTTLAWCEKPHIRIPDDHDSPIMATWPSIRSVNGPTRRRLVLFEEINKEVQRSLINFPIQSTGASLLRRALFSIEEGIRPFRGRILMTLHDEMVVLAQKSDAKKIVEVVEEVMSSTSTALLGVPIPNKLGIGTTLEEARANATRR